EIAEAGLVTPVLRHLMRVSGYMDALKVEGTEEALGRLENLQELLNVSAQYDEESGEPSLGDFLEGVALVADVDRLDRGDQADEGGNDAVVLMTLHSAKGLEFPAVFMVGMEEGVFPHSRALLEQKELEEERRLAYVGMTRAREELTLMHARRRSLNGSPTFNRRSRFLDDLPLPLLDERSLPPESYESGRYGAMRGGMPSVATRFEPSPPVAAVPSPHWVPPFSMGQKVRHPKFGEGTVIAVAPAAGDAQVTVIFQGDATGRPKVLLQKLAKLEAVD
ncbi:MAG: ATP-dependent DNA helicase PcrA, partial [Armatimonadota bacterium]